MNITLTTVETLAPDQASLNAAKKLLKPAKWPLKQRHETLVWAHCQGSGANPYMTVVDLADHGYKCTCPSRKFPCKHALALMWIVAEDGEDSFTTAEVPEWVTDWLGRRRKSTATTTASDDAPKPKKNIHQTGQPTKPTDPEAEKKKQAAQAKRALKTKAATDKAISQGLNEYNQWLNDQLRTGLGDFIDNASERCRNISARLVDAKATTLAGRLDELPAKILSAHKDMRFRVAVNELGKTTWLVKAWQRQPDNPDARRAINLAESRDKLLALADAPRLHGIWQVVGEHIESRRDGLISHATWLRFVSALDGKVNDSTPTFALLQDYYPASAGRRQVVSQLGSFLVAEAVFYPSAYPLRAILTQQEPLAPPPAGFVNPPQVNLRDFFQSYQSALSAIPWLEAMPFTLPAGRFIAQQVAKNQKQNVSYWWQSHADADWQLPLQLNQNDDDSEWTILLASDCAQSFILWDGVYAKFGSSETIWGTL